MARQRACLHQAGAALLWLRGATCSARRAAHVSSGRPSPRLLQLGLNALEVLLDGGVRAGRQPAQARGSMCGVVSRSACPSERWATACPSTGQRMWCAEPVCPSQRTAQLDGHSSGAISQCPRCLQACSSQGEHGMCRCWGEHGMCCCRGEHSICRCWGEHSTCSCRGEHGICRCRDEHGICRYRGEHGICSCRGDLGVQPPAHGKCWSRAMRSQGGKRGWVA